MITLAFGLHNTSSKSIKINLLGLDSLEPGQRIDLLAGERQQHLDRFLVHLGLRHYLTTGELVQYNVPGDVYNITTEQFLSDNIRLSGLEVSAQISDHDNSFVPDTTLNSGIFAQMFMHNNAVATAIGDTNTFYKINGVTTLDPNSLYYLHSDNRLINNFPGTRTYMVHVVLSFEAGSNNVCEFGIYTSTTNSVRVPTTVLVTANSSGRAENVTTFGITSFTQGDYIEIHVRNTSAAQSVTVRDLNVVITLV